MSAHGWVAMIIRPDFYVYGGASQVVELNALVKDFLADLQQAGVRISVADTPSAGPRRIA
jgi:hypothetical protein